METGISTVRVEGGLEVKGEGFKPYRVPYYSWCDGSVKELSVRESVVVVEWVRSMDLGEVSRVSGLKRKKVEDILRRGRIREIVKERMKGRAMVEGMSREGWLVRGMEYERMGGGVGKMGWFFWKELGKAMGWYEEGGEAQVVANFNLVQADGKV